VRWGGAIIVAVVVAVVVAVLVVVEGMGRAELPPAVPPSVARVEPSPAVTRPHVVAANLGFGSAVGVAGLTYMYSGLNPLELEAGLGEGVSGTQASLMVKLASGKGNHRFVTGAGVADTIVPAHGRTQGHPVWLNIDAFGYEFRGHSHGFFSAALGFFSLLGGGRATLFADEGLIVITVGPQFRIQGGVQF
jgi:hypothetical protein